MKNLILEKKTGFFTSLPFTIYDEKGNVFYSSDFTEHIGKGKTLKFNLPFGIYKYEGILNKLNSPITVKNIVLPPKERNYPKKKYKILFGDNMNKCTIFYKLGIILFDKSFLNAPLYIKYSIYFHELGHHFYKTEKFADLYAVKMMLEKGFNPSQIGRTSLFALKESSFDRKEYIINKLTQNKA